MKRAKSTKPEKASCSFYLSSEAADALKSAAQEVGMSTSIYLEHLIKRFAGRLTFEVVEKKP